MAPLLHVAGVIALAAAPGDRVDAFVRARMARSHIPAMAVVVVRGGRTEALSVHGIANLDWDDPASSDTAFQIASTTKPFTGVLLMKLVEQGKVRLDDPVTRYLPDAPDTWRTITLRHLATHTSGLKRDLGPGRDFGTLDEAVAAAYKLPLEYETGTRSQYALTDFVVLTKVMEKVSGRPFVALLREQVTQPLGMEHTGFDDAAQDGAVRSWLPLRHRATTYRWDGSGQRAYAFYYPRFTYAAGGLFSSAADIAKLLAALGEGRLLEPGSLEEMWTPARLADGSTGEFALGWASGRYRGVRAVGHSGGPALSDIVYFPDQKLGIAVLTNEGALFPILADLVADMFLPEDARPADLELADTEPEVTARLRAVVLGLAEGRVRDDDYSEEARNRLVPGLREFGLALLRELEPLSSFRLIGRKPKDGGTEYSYRAFFGKHPMRWRFVLDKESRISDITPSSRD